MQDPKAQGREAPETEARDDAASAGATGPVAAVELREQLLEDRRLEARPLAPGGIHEQRRARLGGDDEDLVARRQASQSQATKTCGGSPAAVEEQAHGIPPFQRSGIVRRKVDFRLERGVMAAGEDQPLRQRLRPCSEGKAQGQESPCH
jgi:hypothetical protein